MSKKDVDDYLTEGMYGTRRPNEAERAKFLGTLRERIVIALDIGEVMTDSGIDELDKVMSKHQEGTQLLINGEVSHRFFSAEKSVANKYDIPYTIIRNTEVDTNIGAVLTYDHAINKEHIFIDDLQPKEEEPEENKEGTTFLSKIKGWFK